MKVHWTSTVKSFPSAYGQRSLVFDPMKQIDLAGNGAPEPGTDPMLGSSFYIGSKEILYKKWGAVRVNLEWKDKPVNFHEHYMAYIKHAPDTGDPPQEENYGLDEAFLS